jgi:hypothetical protein
MMSEKVIELRERLARQIPNWRGMVEKTRKKSHAALPAVTSVPAIPDGSFARGVVTEVVAEKNSCGSALIISALLQRAVESNQLLALIDGLDSFDPTAFSNETLSRLLWVRCQNAGQALKAVDLVLRDRNLSLVLLDLRINPAAQLRKIPSSVWYRLQRIVEAASTTLFVLTPQPMVGSAQMRLNLQSRFGLEALQKPESELQAELKIEISRNRLHVTLQDEGIAVAG